MSSDQLLVPQALTPLLFDLLKILVTAANEEPIPGWIDNINGPSGVIAGAGCGLLRVSRGDSRCIAEMVPVDLVVNSMIAISYKTAKTLYDYQFYLFCSNHNCL